MDVRSQSDTRYCSSHPRAVCEPVVGPGEREGEREEEREREREREKERERKADRQTKYN
jgi:hypothetical protein